MSSPVTADMESLGGSSQLATDYSQPQRDLSTRHWTRFEMRALKDGSHAAIRPRTSATPSSCTAAEGRNRGCEDLFVKPRTKVVFRRAGRMTITNRRWSS